VISHAASSPLIGRLVATAAAILAVVALLVVLSAVHLLPQLRNPFKTTTTVSSQPPLLKSITALSRYEAASSRAARSRSQPVIPSR